MDKELILTKTIAIKAEKSRVWDALINPEITKQYMFGCEPVTDWNIGSDLIWRGAYDGVDYVTGKVIRFEPNSVLSFTTFDPNGKYEDIPINYLTGTYYLSYENGITTLNISQGDFAVAENGKERYEQSVTAWEMSMQNLKNVLEN